LIHVRASLRARHAPNYKADERRRQGLPRAEEAGGGPPQRGSRNRTLSAHGAQPNRISDSSHALTRSPSKLAFPYAYHSPSIFPQSSVRLPVSSLGSLELFPPSFRICPWSDVLSAIVPVPKAPVNKHCDLGRWPCKIRLARHALVSTPSCQSCSSEERAQSLFGRFVSRATHAGHQVSATQAAKRCALLLSVTGPSAHPC